MGCPGEHPGAALGSVEPCPRSWSPSSSGSTWWVRRFGDLITEQRAYLTDLDSAIGDADHGINMDRGMRAVCEARQRPSRHSRRLTVFKACRGIGPGEQRRRRQRAPAWHVLPPASARPAALAMPCSLVDDLAEAFRAGVEGLVARGAGRSWATRPDAADSRRAGARGARRGQAGDGTLGRRRLLGGVAGGRRGTSYATIPMVARKGRASYLGERSAGHQDPGATSSALLFEAAATVFALPS